MGFSKGWQGWGIFLRAKPKGYHEQQPCQPEEKSILPDSFTQTYIIFIIGFHIVPAKMHINQLIERGLHTGFERELGRYCFSKGH